MSETTGTAVPAVPPVATNGTPPAVAAPPPVVPAAAPSQPAAVEDPKWIPERIEQAKRSVLRELGVENVDDAKAAIAELKAKREAEKTEAQRAAEALAAAKVATSETAALKSAVSEFAARQMIGLTAEQKSAVTAIAGEDPALQLKAIAALMPTWAAQAAPATPAAPSAPPQAPNTAPAPNAPPPVVTSPTNHRAHFEALQKTNPFAAAAYGLAHSLEVFGGT